MSSKIKCTIFFLKLSDNYLVLNKKIIQQFLLKICFIFCAFIINYVCTMYKKYLNLLFKMAAVTLPRMSTGCLILKRFIDVGGYGSNIF